MSRVVTGIIIAASVVHTAAAQSQLWLRQIASSTDEIAFVLSPDGMGGTYVAGSTRGSLGSINSGGYDAWLSRYDSAGNRTWISQLGTPGYDYAYALCPDGAGGTFVAGYTEGSLGGSQAGDGDAWLARYDIAGNRTWIRQLGTRGLDFARSLCSDGAGGALVAGSTARSLGGPSSGNQDAWLARYDNAGNEIWIRQFGTISLDDANALSPDEAGGVFVAGTTFGSLVGPSAGERDVYVARYDFEGNQSWIRQFGTSSVDFAFAICSDGANGAFIAGSTLGSLGGTSAGDDDAWLARYDRAGTRIWIRQTGTSAIDVARSLSADGTGGAFIAGNTFGSLGGSNAGDSDAWLARYDSVGSQTWIRQFGSSHTDLAYALSSHSENGAYVAGSTTGSLGGPHAGSGDAWLARYGPTPCPADFNRDGTVDFFDYLDFVAAFAADEPTADFNGNGVVDFFDYLDFVAAFDTGC